MKEYHNLLSDKYLDFNIIQVVNYLTKSKILDDFQTGLRKHHSTQTALIKLTDDIRLAKEKKLATLLLQFDFSKAFDNVSPSRLLAKLQEIGFSKSALMWSYLCGRSQCVFSKQTTSAPRDINIGVSYAYPVKFTFKNKN